MTSIKGSTAQPSSELRKSVRIKRAAESVSKGIEHDRKKPGSKSRKRVDITNPILLEPFNYGWKREVAYRIDPKHHVADVYYYPPNEAMLISQHLKECQESELKMEKTGSQKRSKQTLRERTPRSSVQPLRSCVEVAEFLKLYYPDSVLTVDNFSFLSRPLGLNDPEKEIISKNGFKNKKREADVVKTESKPSIKIPSVSAIQETGKASDTSQIKTVSCERNVESRLSGLNEPRVKVPKMLSISRKRPSCTRKLPLRMEIPVTTTFEEQNLSNSQQDFSVHKKKSGQRRKLSPSSNQLAYSNPPLQQPIPSDRLLTQELEHGLVSSSVGPRSPISLLKEFVHQSLSSSSRTIPCDTSISSIVSDLPTGILANLSRTNLNESYTSHEGLRSAYSSSQAPSNESIPVSPLTKCQLAGALIVNEPTSTSQNRNSSIMNPVCEDLDEKYTKTCIMEPEIEIIDEKKTSHTDELALETPYHFKVVVRKKNDPNKKHEIQRFTVAFGDAPIFPHLCETLRTISPNLRDETFTLHWKDAEGDDILVASCIALREALRVMKKHKLIRFNLTVIN
ncbi:hypothetical protein QAD02_010278 [Eretmocerus hayati]|uniref:Uncharacterized protein n=1 Tax=Eretmocerus hayati TaxID=131215 RepID=A0ACC2NBT5_9HYME|nr:hypothetical protein QAD02_010278 [Eretmocerus hayati]